MHQPDFYFFGLRISEPTNALTDFLVAAICFRIFFELRKMRPDERLFVIFLRSFFGLLGLSMLLAGFFGHAFLWAGPFVAMKLPGWLAGMAAAFCMERAAIERARGLFSASVFEKLSLGSWLALAVFLVAVVFFEQFKWVQIQASWAFLGIVLPVSFFQNSKKKGCAASRQILLGIGVLALASLVFSMKWAFCRWFNHNDIGHVLMAGAVFFFGKGARESIVETAHETPKADLFLNFKT